MTKTKTTRITIKTADDARAYLTTQSFNFSRVQVDDNGNEYEEHRETCKRCGGAGYYPTQFHGACFECGGSPPNRIVRTSLIAIAKRARKVELAANKRARKAAVEMAERNERIAREATEFDAAFPTMRAELADYLPYYCEAEGTNLANKEHRILNDMATKLARYGSISEKAVAFARKMLADEAAPKAVLTEGRYEMAGTIIKADIHESQYGSTWKMTVKLPDGACVWGTVPAAIIDVAVEARVDYDQFLGDILKGAAVTFTATVTRSDKSTDFGFFKRPAKGATATLVTARTEA